MRNRTQMKVFLQVFVLHLGEARIREVGRVRLTLVHDQVLSRTIADRRRSQSFTPTTGNQ
jgi:hypothetical protein